MRFAVKNKQRDILETAEAEAIFKIEWRDKAARLANMLAMITGLRAGEVMALRKDDIRPSSLLIRQAYSVIDKFKTPKNGEARVVQVPFPDVIAALIRRADSNPHGDGLVFYSTRPGKPIEHRQLLAGLRAALETCGIETKATFHSWRHYYTTKLRGTLPDSELQTQTGHKTAAMLDLYGGHQLAEKTARIAQATRAAFNIREFKREGA